MAKSLIADILLTVLLSFISLFLISFYFNAELLNTGYQDWLAQAFRVKQLGLHGLQPWTHDWSNGVSLWRSYQVIPQNITLFFSQIFGVSITRAMVLLTIIQFVLLRLFIYTALRFLKISPVTAFLCALISFNIPHYWKAVGDYSILFGVTLFPLIILLWIHFYNGKIKYLYPYISGISFYFHPLIAIYLFFLWLVSLLLSSRKIFTTTSLIQLAIFIISSSLFWLPISLDKQAYALTSNELFTIGWLQQAFHPYNYFGLSIFIFGLIGLSIMFMLFLGKHTQSWNRSLFLFGLGMICLVFIGSVIQLPKLIMSTQYVRGIIFIGIIFIFTFAPILDYLIKTKLIILKILTALFFTLLLIESIIFTSQYSPHPIKSYDEPISAFTRTHPEFTKELHRAVSPQIGASSYYTPENVFLAGSYNSHLDSNPIPSRLNSLINFQTFDDLLPAANVERLENYFMITGTDLLFFDEASALTNSFSDQKYGYTDLGIIDLPATIYHAFKVPWEPANVVIIDPSLGVKLNHIPFDLNIDKKSGQLQLDDYIAKFVKVVYNEKNTILSVSYPAPSSIEIDIPPDRKSNLIYVSESFDTNWEARFKGKLQKITPVGPNYMLVTLDNEKESGTLILKIKWPDYYIYLISFILIIPIILIGIKFLYKKK